MELFFDILIKFGLPVAAAVTMGIFIYVILTYILAGVVGQVKSITGIIASLDNRVRFFVSLFCFYKLYVRLWNYVVKGF